MVSVTDVILLVCHCCVPLLFAAAQVIILDIRYPSVPITQLARHHSCVNALAWAPHSASHLCTAGDDAQVQCHAYKLQWLLLLRGRLLSV